MKSNDKSHIQEKIVFFNTESLNNFLMTKSISRNVYKNNRDLQSGCSFANIGPD